MWPKKSKKYNQTLDPDLISYGSDSFDFVYFQMLQEITACLEKWTRKPLDYEGYFIPAALIYDPYRDPLFSEMGQGYGIGETKKVLKRLKTTRRLLKSAGKLSAKKTDEKKAVREVAIAYVSGLPRPASMYVDRALRVGGLTKLVELLDDLCALYEAYEAEQKTERGNTRAYRTALVIRAVFEIHTDFEVKARNDANVPDNRFCECLQDAFVVVGLDSKFYHYARNACNCAETDEEFLEIKTLLKTNPAEFPKLSEFY